MSASEARKPQPAPPPGSQVPVGNSVVSYIEVAPGSDAKALAALKSLRAASAKDDGFVSFLLLQRTTHPNHFVLLETWKDNAAREAHLNQPHVKTARSALKALETAPYDERPHKDLAVGQSKPGRWWRGLYGDPCRFRADLPRAGRSRCCRRSPATAAR